MVENKVELEEYICLRCEEITENIAKADWYKAIREKLIKLAQEHPEEYDYLFEIQYKTNVEIYKQAMNDPAYKMLKN